MNRILAGSTDLLLFFFFNRFLPSRHFPCTYASVHAEAEAAAPATLNPAASLSSLERCLQHFSGGRGLGGLRPCAFRSAASADAAELKKKNWYNLPSTVCFGGVCLPSHINRRNNEKKEEKKKEAKKPIQFEATKF